MEGLTGKSPTKMVHFSIAAICPRLQRPEVGLAAQRCNLLVAESDHPVMELRAAESSQELMLGGWDKFAQILLGQRTRH